MYTQLLSQPGSLQGCPLPPCPPPLSLQKPQGYAHESHCRPCCEKVPQSPHVARHTSWSQPAVSSTPSKLTWLPRVYATEETTVGSKHILEKKKYK